MHDMQFSAEHSWLFLCFEFSLLAGSVSALGKLLQPYSLVDSDVVLSGYSLMPGGSLGLDEG